MPTLSIVVPTMNEERYLPRLLSSIKTQTVQPDEILVADAGSKDKTIAIAKDFGARVVAGGLPGPGRNAGAQAARGEIILFLDADVFLPDEHFIANMLQEFAEKHLDIATVDLWLKDGTRAEKLGHQVYNKYVRFWGTWRPHVPGACILVKKTLHDAIHGFDPTVLFCEDQDYVRRANAVGAFGFLNSVKIGVVDRRIKKEGRLGLVAKYILAELYILFFGPIRHDLFRYRFGYDEEE